MVPLFALIASSVFAQSRYPATALCFVRNLPTEVPSDFPEIGVEKQFFAADSSSTAELRIKNLSPKPIIAVQLVLEYYGANGERFGDAIAQAIAKEVPAEQMFAIGKRMDGGGAYEISNLVQPGGTASVDGGGLFATATCPVRAKLTAALLWFSDGTSLDWNAPDSRVDPESDEIPLANLPACLVEHNIDRLFLELDLDNTGRVLKAAGFPPDASQPEPCDLRELGDWKFQPALLGGKPVATKLNLLLRLFGRDRAREPGNLPVSRREALHPVTVVDAFAPAPGKSSWWLFYGSMIPQPPDSH
ncbi:MAG TPA: hypothetical protein VMV59_10550 [Candidatus Dormibacteraeota bacterium]|nr:hypothetical protein [Candidatus Dormibacteraeota bacterium]